MRDLHLSLMRIARLQNESYNPVELQEVIEGDLGDQWTDRPAVEILAQVLRKMHLPAATVLLHPDPSSVPALVYQKGMGWGVLQGLNALENWVFESYDESKQAWVETIFTTMDHFFIARVRLSKPFHLQGSKVFQLIKNEMLSHRKLLIEASVGGAVINLIALGSSFYSMQVYDRVVPTGGVQTLLVLTLGVCFSAILEFVAKLARSKLYEEMIDATDRRLSRAVFMKFLAIRLDQMPLGVGSMAGQLRGYETVRSFLTTVATQILVDLPFCIIFISILAVVVGGLVFVPLAFFVLAIFLGLFYRKRMERISAKATEAANLKMGILVEAIEGAETIKSGHAGWRVLSKWMRASDEARTQESEIRKVSDQLNHTVSIIQQLSYVGIVAMGALLVSTGTLTMGAMVAASMLSGRILGPVCSIPPQLLMWGNVKAALVTLDKIWELKDDHHGIERPIQIENIRGDYVLDGVECRYLLNPSLIVSRLEIKAGEKIGVMGTIGAGKTTLLRLLSGMYKPQMGRILLDGVDLSHISKPLLSEKIGYLQQDGRLFAGTLRENLILGMPDPGDDAILKVATETGLLAAVLIPHPKGLQQEITEGGVGLSGGQRQLVNLTRVFLRKPKIWLLDEPTASMDSMHEQHILGTLKNNLAPDHTLILVTHKPAAFALVDRLIIISNQQIVLDGPKELVLQKLMAHQQNLQQVKV